MTNPPQPFSFMFLSETTFWLRIFHSVRTKRGILRAKNVFLKVVVGSLVLSFSFLRIYGSIFSCILEIPAR